MHGREKEKKKIGEKGKSDLPKYLV